MFSIKGLRRAERKAGMLVVRINPTASKRTIKRKKERERQAEREKGE